jgi:exonuclease SbcC
LKAAQRSLAKLEKRESELAAGAATVSDRREALEKAAELLTGSITARKTATEAAKAADKAEADADRQAEESGFDSTKAAEDAARDDTTLEALKRDLAVYDQRLALVTKQLDEDLAGIDPDEEIDLGPATEAAQEAGASYKEASEIAGVASDRFETFRRETQAVAGYYEELGPLRDAARTSAELWRMTNGENDRKMNLSIFVLATRLRQVIEAANRHLQSMSDQRYELLYSGDKKGNAMAGLGIEVFDSYTSEARPTTTLSGGESFYASLALALGLAEVVQQESGGNRQETLFIDEGFGTLDPESLDKVMDVIDSLREGGRSVGLVSHVEELKNRIAAKIVVTPGQDGSTLEVTNG